MYPSIYSNILLLKRDNVNYCKPFFIPLYAPATIIEHKQKVSVAIIISPHFTKNSILSILSIKKHVFSCIPYLGQFYVLFHAGYPTSLIYKGAGLIVHVCTSRGHYFANRLRGVSVAALVEETSIQGFFTTEGADLY